MWNRDVPGTTANAGPIERSAPVSDSLLVRAIRRVARHRWEAAAVVAFIVVVTGLSAVIGGYHRLIGALQGAPAIWGSVLVAFALLWVPIAVIDARRCTRETALRTAVSADLEVRRAAERNEEARHREIETRVGQVLGAQGPRIVYQPIVDMVNGEAIAYEALSRFPDSVSPDRWFAEAGVVGLRRELELAAMRAALGGLAYLPEGTALSVNVSPDVLAEPGTIGDLCAQASGRLILEVTENVVIDDYGQFRDAFEQLRACGVRLAVDDAGAGFASFRHIVDLSLDIIKVDGSLIRNIDADPARRSLMAAFVSFAGDIGATLVAECVETAEEEAELRRWGLRYGQGWFYGKPQSLDLRSLLVRAGGSLAGDGTRPS